MKLTYRHSKLTCYIGYFTQASVITFLPLLFTIFQTSYHFPYAQLGILTTINFCVQMLMDLVCTRLVDRIGYRKSLLLASGLTTIGFGMVSLLPNIMTNSYVGLCIAVVFYAAGGAIIDTAVNPMMTALPVVDHSRHTFELSLLHAVFCWSQVILILGTTLFLKLFGSDAWWVLPLLLAFVSICNFIMLLFVPVPDVVPAEKRSTVKQLFKNKLFLLMCIGMICSGGIELVMAQWGSSFAENALHLSKSTGNLVGPCLLAFTMAVGRTLYGVKGEKLDLIRSMIWGSVGALLSYILVGMNISPIIDIIGYALVGFCVSFMWPGTMSICADNIPMGGAGMFALLAIFGDGGGSVGPVIAGWITDKTGGDLHSGLLFGAVFCVFMLGCLLVYKTKYQNKKLH